MTTLDYLAHLDAESERFGDILAGADLVQPVPSCPDWTAGDLFWHLTEVQWFWGTIVRERVSDPAEIEAERPERPTDLDSLCHLFATVSTDLHGALTAASAQTPVWTWAPDKTVGFIRRRQAHEALIHRIDAELATGRGPDTWASIDPALAADGVDEVLRIMHGGIPDWGTFDLDGRTARVEATDTGARWGLVFGRFTGTDPRDGTSYDEDAFDAADDNDAAGGATGADATVRGTAADLDCWLWGRLAADRVERRGDAAVLDRMQAVITAGID
ncbi:MAG TPA: maleylpyruvate isomerase N-terminal domain-containing protein [Nocardioidaceae bacterium]|nr:maleylpyruvate isomerase N-terminal domain-containing protein [Nocardioidaceae bacterium]